ncbi:glycoside hydrolase family 114 protein [Dendryphion nanum]|uniref:alpha-galactosidase n=1 Tax=Dendryphion nanum TaxID=256645 RepID=A0A9P9ILI3_9PLEO|nr:glycoside hydrolase family 114 protein [Dendryphion nanum]
MYLSTVTVIVSGAGIVLAHPFKNVAREVASFPAGASWDILLNSAAVGNIKKISDQSFSIIDIDLFDTDSQTIADLKSTKTVICYFSAGTREEWRPDAGDFKSGDVGKNMEEWAGEAWLNVKSDSVRKIMQNRIKQAADKGCQAIDPDNTDGFGGNQDGFGYGKAVYVDYLRFLAQEAKSNGLAIGLKNSLDIIPDLVDVMSFAINEQCHQYKECAQYKPFTDQNKAVFNIEYGGNACDNPAGVKLSTLIKPEDQGMLPKYQTFSQNSKPNVCDRIELPWRRMCWTEPRNA